MYDLHVKAENTEEISEMAKKLGWTGLAIIVPWKSYGDFERKDVGDIEMFIGVEISESRISEMKKTINKLRRKVELIAVNSNSPEMTRAAVETPEVDVVTNVWSHGINHIIVNIAAKSDVALCFDFRDLLHSHKRFRTELMSKLLEGAKIIRKYKAPFIISSGAVSSWDLRSPSELTAFGRVLGFTENHISQALSNDIIIKNRKRLSGQWVMPGVEMEC